VSYKIFAALVLALAFVGMAVVVLITLWMNAPS